MKKRLFITLVFIQSAIGISTLFGQENVDRFKETL